MTPISGFESTARPVAEANLSTSRVLKKSLVDARQGGKRRKSAVYWPIHEHFESLSNAVWRRQRVFQQPARVSRKASQLEGPLEQVSRSNRLGGFTLLEILLVLAIIGVASLVVFPSITGLETRTFNARVREAHTLLNLARRTAVVSGQPSIARFSVLPPEDAADQTPLSPLNVGRWDGSGIELTFEDSADQEITVEDNLDITFFPEGGSTGGNLVLTQQGRLASIVINPFTGRVATEFLDER